MSTAEASRSDADLLRAHVDGDSDAFAQLFRRHRDRLWAVALRTTGNPDDAGDALQDALISAFRRADSFRGDSAVTSWLHRITVNACLDRIRASQRHPTQPLPDLDSARDAALPTTPDPASVVVAHSVRDEVLHALAQLPEEQRVALVLVDMEGFSVREAAEICDVATGTVKSRCSRGRRTLAGLLGALSGNQSGGSDVSSEPGPVTPVRRETTTRGVGPGDE